MRRNWFSPGIGVIGCPQMYAARSPARGSPMLAVMTTRSDQTVMKLRSPEDILEAIPYVLGFEPTDCLVALSLRGPRRRLGLTLRVDLVDPAGTDLVAEQVVGALRADRAESVLLVGYGQEASHIDPLVAAVQSRLDTARIAVPEALRVVPGRWTSYTCANPACCPTEGTPVRDRLRAPGHVGPAAVAAGQQVLPGREALVATLAPVTGLLRCAMEPALDRELDRLQLQTPTLARSSYAQRTVGLVRTTLERNPSVEDGPTSPLELGVDDAARMIVGLTDATARDACLDGFEPFGPELGVHLSGEAALPAHLRPEAGRLWSELVRRAVRPGLVAPPATLLAWNRYVHHSGGALMTIALQRAWDDVPDYYLAGALQTLLANAVAPAAFTRMVAAGEGRAGKRRAARRQRRSA